MLTLCYHLTLTLLLGVFVLSRSFVTLSSRHPLQATLTCRLGCLGGSVRCPSLPSFPVPSIIKFSKLFPSFFPHNTLHKRHWRATWLPRWECLWFSFPPSGTCDSFDPRRRLSLSQACLILFSVAALCLSFRVSIHFILFFNLVYAVCPSF